MKPLDKYTPPKKLSGNEPFRNTADRRFRVRDFWQYAYSELNSNITRGVLAEFIVENALKARPGIRDPWADWDVESGKLKIEVKCSAYVQAWDHRQPSRITFSGLKATTLKKKSVSNYKANVYVLCLFKASVRRGLQRKLLDMDNWEFFVLSRKRLRKVSKDSGSISLSTLEKNAIEPVGFQGIRKAVLAAKKA